MNSDLGLLIIGGLLFPALLAAHAHADKERDRSIAALRRQLERIKIRMAVLRERLKQYRSKS